MAIGSRRGRNNTASNRVSKRASIGKNQLFIALKTGEMDNDKSNIQRKFDDDRKKVRGRERDRERAREIARERARERERERERERGNRRGRDVRAPTRPARKRLGIERNELLERLNGRSGRSVSNDNRQRRDIQHDRFTRRDSRSGRNEPPINALAAALGMGKSSDGSNSGQRFRSNGGNTTRRNGGSDNNNNNKSKNYNNSNANTNSNSNGHNNINNNNNNNNVEFTKNNTGRKANDLTFRNASLIPFLRIENLTEDASESDISMVLNKLFGPTLKILKMNSTYKKVPSVTAEVFFLNENNLPEMAQRLNGINADGRQLKATIAYHSWIINSDRLWEEELKEVRMYKQQAIRKSMLMAANPGDEMH